MKTSITHLARARARQRLTQRELADRAGLSEACVQRIECGSRRPRPSTQVRLADALDADAEDLFGASA